MNIYALYVAYCNYRMNAQIMDWTKHSNIIWFQISVFLTLFLTEICPIIYICDHRQLSSTIIAFDNWRMYFMNDPNGGNHHHPLLSASSRDPLSGAGPSFGGSGTGYLSSVAAAATVDAADDDDDHASALARSSVNGMMADAAAANRIVTASSIRVKENEVERAAASINWDSLEIDDTFEISSSPRLAFSMTHKARCSGLDVCLRSFRCDGLPSSMALLTDIEARLSAMCGIYHDFICPLYAICHHSETQSVRILSKWYPKGSLYDVIVASPSDTPFSMYAIKQIALQLAGALVWLHDEYHIPHGFVKSRNILVCI